MSFLIPLCLLITLINGHGYLNDPTSRAVFQKMFNRTNFPEAEFSGGLIYQYYYRGIFFITYLNSTIQILP